MYNNYCFPSGSSSYMPVCRNGRRDRLKICCQQWRVGSSPTTGTKQNPLSKEGGFLFVLFIFHYSSFIIHLPKADFEESGRMKALR